MGLDVYLYRYEDYDAVAAVEKAAEAEINALFSRDDISDKDRDAERARVAEKYGTDTWGDHATGKQKIQEPSAKHPDHYFKIGYFRSSYNAGGIDHILGDRIGTSLSDICGAGDDYHVKPDWTAMRARAEKALADLRAWTAANGNYRVVESSSLTAIRSEKEALAIVTRQAAKWKDRAGNSFKAYSNAEGLFYCDEAERPKVVAVFNGHNCIGTPCAYVVVEDSTDGVRRYEQALEVVVETCDFVLGHADPERFVLHWSS